MDVSLVVFEEPVVELQHVVAQRTLVRRVPRVHLVDRDIDR